MWLWRRGGRSVLLAMSSIRVEVRRRDRAVGRAVVMHMGADRQVCGVADRMTELYTWKMRCDRCELVIAGHAAKAKGWWRCMEADTIRLNPIDICAECWKEMWEQSYERRRDTVAE
jgi:hypothetical protein